MKETWHLLQSGPGSAAHNMAVDEALLEAAPRLGRPVLRFYGWSEAAATFGYFQKHADIADWTRLRPLIRRPTGGGLVPHDGDWTYSLAFPRAHAWCELSALESYQCIHEWIHRAWMALGVTTELSERAQNKTPGRCFAGAEKFDLLWNGQKIAGAAQRRSRDGLLIQGSVQPPGTPATRADWEARMRENAPWPGGILWAPLEPDPLMNQRVQELVVGKYSQPAYNEHRQTKSGAVCG